MTHGSKPRWGILSSGRMADWFTTDFQAAVTSGEIIACASRSQSSADQFALKHNIPQALDNYEALFEHPDVEVIYIPTPHNHHKDNAIAAMRAGKAVLLEKPFTVHVGETRELIKVQQETGAYLMEAMWTWFLPAIQQAKTWVTEGRLGGPVVQVKADFGYPIPYSERRPEYDVERSGSALLEMGVYPVALANLFLDGELKRVQSSCGHAPNGIDDESNSVLEFESGTAVIGSSFRSRLGNNAYLIGKEGWIHIPDFFRATEAVLYHLDDKVEHFADDRNVAGWNFQADAVNSDLIAGRTGNETVPLSATLRTMELIEAIRASFQTS